MSKVKLMLGDCLDKLKKIPDNYVDSIVTDPPAGISFMGKGWDSDKGGRDYWIAWMKEIMIECNRVLKPGGHMFVWSLPRTSHWTATAVEDGGFEIRDVVSHVFGSGFPKSHNIGKAIDKTSGVSIGWFGEWLKNWRIENNISQESIKKLFPSKTGRLTGCVSNWELGNNLPTNEQFNLICRTFNLPFDNLEEAEREYIGSKKSGIGHAFTNDGWGSGTDEVAITKGSSKFEGWGSALKPAHEDWVLASKGHTDLEVDSKFIYQAKPSGKEKNLGLDEFEEKSYKDNNNGARTYNSRCKNCGKKFIGPKDKICNCGNPETDESILKMKNNHPTIKSTKLMSYLINMITPPQGIVLDPFMGSGSTGVAAVENGFSFIGIELSPEYMEIAKARIEYTRCQKDN